MNDRLFIIVSVLTLKNLKSRTSAFGAYVHSNAVLPSILTPDDAFFFFSPLVLSLTWLKLHCVQYVVASFKCMCH